MRERQPRLLVIWGKYDPSFDLLEPEAYQRDVRTLRSTLSTQGISLLIPEQMKLRRS